MCPRLLLLPLLAAGLPALAEPPLTFTARPAPDASGTPLAAVGAGPVVLMRLQGAGGHSALERAQAAADVLRQAALAAATGRDVRVEVEAEAKSEAQARYASILVGPRKVVSVEQAEARRVKSTAPALARLWAAAIATLLDRPYLLVTSPTELLVPLHETRSVSVAGTARGPFSFRVEPREVATASFQGERQEIEVRGQARGRATVQVEVGEIAFAIAADVKPWAILVPDGLEAGVSGGVLREDNLDLLAHNVLLPAVTLAPGAQTQVRALAAEDGRLQTRVQASGEGSIPVDRTVPIALRPVTAPEAAPTVLFVSNSPERVAGPGALLRQRLPRSGSARLLFHHINDAQTAIRLGVRLVNRGLQPASAHVLMACAGPETGEMHVGHMATRRFWDDLLAHSGYVVRVPPGQAALIATRDARPGQVISGLAQITALSGPEVLVEVLAQPAEGPPAWLAAAATGDLPLTDFAFPPVKRFRLEYRVDDPWTFFRIGDEPSRSEGGELLRGDYGVTYEVEARVANDGEDGAEVEVALRAGGGAARAVALVDGRLVESDLLGFGEEHVLARVTVPAHGRQAVQVALIPQSASNYPLTLILRTFHRPA